MPWNPDLTRADILSIVLSGTFKAFPSKRSLRCLHLPRQLATILLDEINSPIIGSNFSITNVKYPYSPDVYEGLGELSTVGILILGYTVGEVWDEVTHRVKYRADEIRKHKISRNDADYIAGLGSRIEII